MALPDTVYLYRNMFISCSSMLGSREISVVLRRRPCTGCGVKSLGSQHRNMFLVQVSEALSTMIEITLKCQYVTPPFKFSHYKYTFFGSDMFLCVCAKSLQSCFTLCDCQAPLSMGILQARILKWVAISWYTYRSFIVLHDSSGASDLKCRVIHRNS